MKKLIGFFSILLLFGGIALNALHTMYTPLYGNDVLPVGFQSVMRLVADAYASRGNAIVLQYQNEAIFTFARPVSGADAFVFTNWSVSNKAIGVCESCPGIGQAVNRTTFSEFAKSLEESGWHKLTREQIPNVLPSSMLARASLAMSVLRSMAHSETMLLVVPVCPFDSIIPDQELKL